MKHICLSSGKNVWVLDDVFNYSDVQSMELFCERSTYRVGASSTPSIGKANHTFMQSVFSEQDVDNFGIFAFESSKLFTPFLVNKYLDAAWVLAATRSDKYFYHADISNGASGVTFLFFANCTWDKDWGNEMLFASDKAEAEIAITCKPNRVVLFDSSIPHKPSPSATDAPQYAYMFVAQFLDKTQ